MSMLKNFQTNNMKKLVVLTGAGISAESGLATFRGSGGLWEGFNIKVVCSKEGWEEDPAVVLDFYEKRRLQAMAAEPNEGHKILAEFQNHFDMTIITQNVDDLHERAGSKNVIHIHGELSKSRSTADPSLTYPIPDGRLGVGDLCELGSQLRPDIVWFGEDTKHMAIARYLAKVTDIFMIVGTSLQVYPAAGLKNYVKPEVPIYIVDPNDIPFQITKQIHFIQEMGSVGLKKVFEELTAIKI